MSSACLRPAAAAAAASSLPRAEKRVVGASRAPHCGTLRPLEGASLRVGDARGLQSGAETPSTSTMMRARARTALGINQCARAGRRTLRVPQHDRHQTMASAIGVGANRWRWRRRRRRRRNSSRLDGSKCAAKVARCPRRDKRARAEAEWRLERPSRLEIRAATHTYNNEHSTCQPAARFGPRRPWPKPTRATSGASGPICCATLKTTAPASLQLGPGAGARGQRKRRVSSLRARSPGRGD